MSERQRLNRKVVTVMTLTEVSEDTLDLDDLDLPAEWSRFKEEQKIEPSNCGCPVCNSPSRDSFLDWLRPRLADPDQIDDLQWCGDCNEPGTDLNFTGNETWVCDSCFQDYYRCEDCESYFTETTTTLRDREVCESCRQDNYSYCDDCNGYYLDGYGCGEDHDDSCQCEAPAQNFTVRNDGDELLTNDTRVTVALPAGTISAEGLSQIAHYIRGYRWEVEDMAEKDSLYNLSYSVSELGDRWQTKEGNFTKRLSKLAYKKHGLKVRPGLLSQIGCIARDNSTAVDFEIEVTRDLNLDAGDFYHEDSCWWQSYAYSRCALKSSGGFGLRTFGYGVTGRAWVMPLKIDDDGQLAPTFETLEPAAFIVFNGYGNLSGYTPARIVSHMAGMTYRKIHFICSPMYVNGDSGYLVAPEEIASKYTDGSLQLAVGTTSEPHSTLHYSEMEARNHVLVAA